MSLTLAHSSANTNKAIKKVRDNMFIDIRHFFFFQFDEIGTARTFILDLLLFFRHGVGFCS